MHCILLSKGVFRRVFPYALVDSPGYNPNPNPNQDSTQVPWNTPRTVVLFDLTPTLPCFALPCLSLPCLAGRSLYRRCARRWTTWKPACTWTKGDMTRMPFNYSSVGQYCCCTGACQVHLHLPTRYEMCTRRRISCPLMFSLALVHSPSFRFCLVVPGTLLYGVRSWSVLRFVATGLGYVPCNRRWILAAIPCLS